MKCVPVKRGSTGKEVRELQSRLRREDLDIVVDGVFGAATELAVKIYQGGQHIYTDGIVGPKTWTQFEDSG